MPAYSTPRTIAAVDAIAGAAQFFQKFRPVHARGRRQILFFRDGLCALGFDGTLVERLAHHRHRRVALFDQRGAIAEPQKFYLAGFSSRPPLRARRREK